MFLLLVLSGNTAQGSVFCPGCSQGAGMVTHRQRLGNGDDAATPLWVCGVSLLPGAAPVALDPILTT